MIKLFSKTNKILILILTIALLFALVGCGNNTNEESTNNNDELYSKAIGILEEFSEDQRINDFLNAYDLLMTLPSNVDKFISQLGKVNGIFEKYGVEFKYGGWYLQPYLSEDSITENGIEEYRTKSAYWDVTDLLEAIVYPVLFEKYGNEAQSIKGITAERIISTIKSTNDYSLDDKTEQYDGCKEEWKYVGTPKTKYEIKYHNNGLVERITIPIVRSDTPLNDDEYIAFFDKDVETQKQLAGSRFISMTNQFSTIVTGYDVLSKIFSDEDIAIISNYIHSLTIEDIWKRNLYTAVGGESTDYFGAIVMFDYKGNSVGIHYNLNDISLNVTGKNYVNPLTHRWYTLWCGLGLPDGESKEKNINLYDDYINNNTAYNSIIQDYSFDLDANANNFVEIPINNEQPQGNENTATGEVQQSIPVEMSMSEEITVYGVIEKNDTAFPSYRLRLTPKLTIIFDEYIGEKVFECEYMYFYDEAELNGYFAFNDFVGYSCEVTALLEDYRGGNELFLLKPTFSKVLPD